MKFTAVGDTAIQKVLPKYYDGFEKIRDYIAKGEARFFNLETTVNTDCFANMYSGGTWLRTSPEVLESTKEFGFNLTTFANNHCMDYSYNGLLQTIDNLNKCKYHHSGVGRNLAEASAPVYLDLPGGRVALISCTTDFAPGGLAGEQSRRLPGRPGVNGLRIKTTVKVSYEDMAMLKNIAAKTGVNIDRDSSVKLGYTSPEPDNELNFGGVNLIADKEYGIKMEIDKSDVSRIEKAIDEAAFQADYVLISLHSHDRQYEDADIPADFIQEFARHCIDCGAHAIIGHGPHHLRPVEIYKNRPIFYSLGDFVLHLENCELAPEDFYSKFGLTSYDNMHELFTRRTKNFTIGLQRRTEMMEAVIPYFEMEDGKLTHLEFIPIELGFGMKHPSIGWPRKAQGKEILERFAKMSEPFGTKFLINGESAEIIL